MARLPASSSRLAVEAPPRFGRVAGQLQHRAFASSAREPGRFYPDPLRARQSPEVEISGERGCAAVLAPKWVLLTGNWALAPAPVRQNCGKERSQRAMVSEPSVGPAGSRL